VSVICSIIFAILASPGLSMFAWTFGRLRLAAADVAKLACFAARTEGSSRTSSYSLRMRVLRLIRSGRSVKETSAGWGVWAVLFKGSVVDGIPKSAAKSSLVRIADRCTCSYDSRTSGRRFPVQGPRAHWTLTLKGNSEGALSTLLAILETISTWLRPKFPMKTWGSCLPSRYYRSGLCIRQSISCKLK